MGNSASTLPYKLQSDILDYAESKGLELADALEHFEVGFDDLVYINSKTKRWTGGRPPDLDDFRSEPNDIPFVSFFSGCGGMDLGFEAAGFQHIAAFEINELFCKTLRRNRPHWNVVGPPTSYGDVSDVEQTVDRLHQHIDPPFMGVFIGGPPCQPFSIAANQRFSKSGEKYKRIGFDHEEIGCLLFDYVALIEHFQAGMLCHRERAWTARPGWRRADKTCNPKARASRLRGAGAKGSQRRALWGPTI